MEKDRYIPSTKEDIQAHLQKRMGNLSVARVAKMFGVTTVAVRKWLKDGMPAPNSLRQWGLEPCLRVTNDEPLPQTEEEYWKEEARRLQEQLDAASAPKKAAKKAVKKGAR